MINQAAWKALTNIVKVFEMNSARKTKEIYVQF